jgi:hypothetical protein
LAAEAVEGAVAKEQFLRFVPVAVVEGEGVVRF